MWMRTNHLSTRAEDAQLVRAAQAAVRDHVWMVGSSLTLGSGGTPITRLTMPSIAPGTSSLVNTDPALASTTLAAMASQITQLMALIRNTDDAAAIAQLQALINTLANNLISSTNQLFTVVTQILALLNGTFVPGPIPLPPLPPIPLPPLQIASANN